VQRAIDRGAAALGKARQLDAGPAAQVLSAKGVEWNRLAGSADALSTEIGRHAGVFAADDRLMAVNRPAAEDAGRIAADDRIDGLFRDLTYSRLAGTAGSTDSLVQEIWRAFLIAMVLALAVEGLLCMPKPAGLERSPLEGLRPVEAAA
jgi:predicted nucleic acid-binding protein